MFRFDLPVDELRTFTLPQIRQPDFAAFWERMLVRSEEQPINPESQSLVYAVPHVKVEKVSFEAFDGGRIVGWLVAPVQGSRHPTLIQFHGYGGGRGNVSNYLMWALQGFAVLTFDVRGQNGESTDAAAYPDGRSPGWMSWGILEPEKYYFVRAYVDTVRAMDYACSRIEVDPERIGITGCSQGGGLSLAAVALDSRYKLCMAEVPAFCHFRRMLEMTKAAPWTDLIVRFQRHPELIEPAMQTLSYVEINNLAERIQCPTLVTVGMQDELCPPSTIFAAYNRIPAEEKQIDVFDFNGHEANLNIETMIAWARRHLM